MSLRPRPSSKDVAAFQARADLDVNVAQLGEVVEHLVRVDPSGRWLLAFVDSHFIDPATADDIVPLLHNAYTVIKNAAVNLERLSAIVNADEKLTRIWSGPGFTGLEVYPPTDEVPE